MENVRESSFKFGDIKILKLDFECNEILDEGEHEIQIEREVDFFEINKDIENKIFENRVILNLKISTIDNKAMVFSTIQGNFKSEGIEEPRSNILFQQNAPALLLSYLRPIISMVSQQTYFPIEIPFLNFTKSEQVDK